MTFLEYIAWRVQKFGAYEQLRYSQIEEGLYEYDSYLAINLTLSLKEAKFRLVNQSSGKYYYKDI